MDTVPEEDLDKLSLSDSVLRSQDSKFIFYLLTNTFSSHDLFPPPFHHMTLSPDHLPNVLTM